jgi:hypothetical protein
MRGPSSGWFSISITQTYLPARNLRVGGRVGPASDRHWGCLAPEHALLQRFQV